MNETPARPTRIPEGIVALADYERLAEQRLDADAWAYFSGGAGGEITKRWNRDAFDRTALLPRVLNAGRGGHTRIELLGRTFEHPILVAPLAHQCVAHPDGECAAAMGAGAQDACYVLSTLASMPLDDVARAAGPRRWFQLYCQSEREQTLDLVRRAEAAGYEAIVMTVDAPVSLIKFKLPEGVSPVNLASYPPKPPAEPIRSAVFDYFLPVAPTWKDVEWLTAGTSLPVLIKGILTADDADLAARHGAAGIIVSNHGGRMLDTLPATFDVLPAILERVAGRMPVLVDGGIRRGTDVLKCMAAGASAVLVGRPVVYGLTVAGALGVSHVLRLLRDELEMAMALTGCLTLADADARLLQRLR